MSGFAIHRKRSAPEQQSGVGQDGRDFDVSDDFTIRARREIANEGRHFDLLGDRTMPVVLALPIEITQKGRAKTTDGGELAGAQLFLLDKAFQAGHYFVV